MPEQDIEIPLVGTVTFPDGMSDADITAAVKKLYDQAVESGKPKPGTLSGFTLAGAGKAAPYAADSLLNFATSPTVPKTIGGLARTGVTLGAIGHGLATGSPTEVLAAPMEGWAAGKGGYFLGKGAQSAVKPVASALDAAAPYAQGLSTLGGAQGINDLAQMAEPNRKDIGFLGMAPSVNVPGAKPPLINALYQALMERLQK
jgi:hypothetical protein